MLRFLQRHPFLKLLIPLVVGIVCGEYLPSVEYNEVCLPVLGGLLILMIICHSRCYTYVYGATAFLFFVVLGFMRVGDELRLTDYAFTGETSVYQIVLTEKPELKAKTMLCRAVPTSEWRNDTLIHPQQEHTFLFYIAKDSASEALRRGDLLWVETCLAPPANNGIPDEFDYARYLIHKGISGTAYVPAGHWRKTGNADRPTFRQTALEMRDRITNLYRTLGFQGDELAVLSALTVGDKEELSEEITETYSVSGASHVLALSGLHIGFIYALFWFFFSPLWRRWRLLKPLLSLLIILFLWGFAFLTGLSSSVVRSVVMFSLFILASLRAEKTLTMDTLLVTAFLMLLYHPFWLLDVGFQLSFSAVAAILLLQSRFYALWPVKHRWGQKVWGMMTVSVAAQIGVAPLIIFYFSRFSTHFLLTNLWVIPLVSVIMYAAVLLLILTPFPALQQPFASVVEVLVRVQNEGLRWIEQLPLASIDNLWLTMGEVFLLYLLCYVICRYFNLRTVRRAFTVGWICIGFLICRFFFFTVDTPDCGVAFYNVRGCPAVHCLSGGGRSWLVCADSLTDTSRYHRALASRWNRFRIDTPRIVRGTYSAEGLQVDNQVILYAGKRICLITDSRWRYMKTDTPLDMDYLYISKGYRGNGSELLALFSANTVILDASLSAAYQNRLEAAFNLKGVPCIRLEEAGFVEDW
ncbi:MAG: ComEC/Rec2 family competence protein [Bacteroides sp.]|nr:ComEC/Rec2 family competence protein [Bacteroides sp.]